MKDKLFHLLLYFQISGICFGAVKPGSCPDISDSTFGACVIACGDDSHCQGFQKCCSTGCGQICSEPACPKNVSKVSCPQSLCRFSQCPNAPDAQCRIDSCGKCTVEYYNSTTWKKIECINAGQNLCERMRDYARRGNRLLGRYTPKCTTQGKFQSIQIMGSVVFCVDEETGIPDFTTQTNVGNIRSLNCKTRAEKKVCEVAREAALNLPPIGRFVPSCKPDGSFEEKQCHASTGFCWCVDKDGREWFGSRKRGKIECPRDMCPAGVKIVQDCDPMICSAASCPGHTTRDVTCRVNPCGQCKAEFLDKNNQLVKCQTCANVRAGVSTKSNVSVVGQFVPECDLDGNYKEVQCWGSVGLCWCVDRFTGKQVDGTMTRGTPTCRSSTTILLGSKGPSKDIKGPAVCPNGFPMMLCLRPYCQWSKGCAVNSNAKCRVNPCKGCAVEYFDQNNKLIDCNQDMSECELKRADALSSKSIGLQPVGRFVPECDKAGNYTSVQCWPSTGYCWCVDPITGEEKTSTRVRGTPDCKDSQSGKGGKRAGVAGRCPIAKPSDVCTSSCVNDSDCAASGKRCCEIGCGKTCLEPAQEPLACENGMPYLLCLHHCQLASCPAHPDALCSVDPCRMCKVEFKDPGGRIVDCSGNMTSCQLEKAQSPRLIGSFTPRCEADGSYSPLQCYGSIGYCWCVDKHGQEINNTRSRRRINCTEVSTRKGLTKCEQMRANARGSMLLGAKTPQCEADGRFKRVQSWEGYRWCVDENGIELPGTRVGRGEQSPNCSKACSPVMCAMYCQYGFQKDSRGCDICKCASTPSKPGACPKSPTTERQCRMDLDCPGVMKCCDTKCSQPISHVKPGLCPIVNTSYVGDCESKCSRDDHCSGRKKCCASGCSRKCVHPATEVCPSGVPLVMCLRNMCANDTCPGHPNALCRMNFCGHCSAKFVYPNGTLANCGKPDVKPDMKSIVCENKNKTMYFCSSSLCNGRTCTSNPRASCRVPTFSCECSVKFYDERGNDVDCLTECQRRRKNLESGLPLIGAYKPSCEEDGTYSLLQCHGSIRFCWCAFPDGTEWPGTQVRGVPDCNPKKSPIIRSVKVILAFDNKFDNIKDALNDFKKMLEGHLKDKFGLHPQQIQNLKITEGSILVEFELLKYEEGTDIRNASSLIRSDVLRGGFVVQFGGETMIAKPDSYSQTTQLASTDDNEVSVDDGSTPVLAIVLGVVFGSFALILIIGGVILIRKRRGKNRGMSINTYDSGRPLEERCLSD